MGRKILAVVVMVMLAASVSYAENLFDVLSSVVKATTSGVKKVVTGANPGKVVSNTAEGTVEGTQKMGEAAFGGVTNTVGAVSGESGNK